MSDDLEKQRQERRHRQTGFQRYWEWLGVDMSISDPELFELIEERGYVTVDLSHDGSHWTYGTSPIDTIMDHLLESGVRFEGRWSGCQGVGWSKLWFSTPADAVLARLVCGV